MEQISVYILQCADNSLCVGLTRRAPNDRLAEHNLGLVRGYTKPRRPVRLVYSQSFDRITDAIAAERQLKGWSRAKKMALIKGDFYSLSRLARRKS